MIADSNHPGVLDSVALGTGAGVPMFRSTRERSPAIRGLFPKVEVVNYSIMVLVLWWVSINRQRPQRGW